MCEAETHAFCLFYDVIIDKKMVEQSDEGWTGAHMEPFKLKFGDRRRKIARLASRQHEPWGKVSLSEKMYYWIFSYILGWTNPDFGHSLRVLKNQFYSSPAPMYDTRLPCGYFLLRWISFR